MKRTRLEKNWESTPRLVPERTAFRIARKFVICRNRPENDLHWAGTSTKRIVGSDRAQAPSVMCFFSFFNHWGCFHWGSRDIQLAGPPVRDEGFLRAPGSASHLRRPDLRVSEGRPPEDSTDPYWVSKASMSRRHRFLTTKARGIGREG